jgi:light-regulated signal transduction histidine kinase (bacteriophytochrome)
MNVIPHSDNLPDRGQAQVNQPDATTAPELKRYVSDLERANRMFDASIRAASHDLKSPLATIQMELSLLLSRSAALPDELVRPVRETIKACEEMRRLIDALPSTARTSIQEVDLEEIDLNGLLEEVLAAHRSAIESARAQITVDFLPTIRAHRERIRELLGHLIANAIEHCGARTPVVYITAEYSGPDWVFCVEDNGEGPLANDRERAFDAFVCVQEQPPASSGRDPPNLGLAMCKRVVQAHGGRIWIESEPGEGNTILFTLPTRLRKPDATRT